MQALPSTFAHFQRYVRQPHYTLPLADQPTTKVRQTIRHFLAEYPLLLSLLLVSIGTILLAHSLTGEDFYKPLLQKYSSSAGILATALLLVVILEEAVFRAILRLTPKRLRNMSALLLWIPLGYYHQRITDAEVGSKTLWWLLLAWVVAVCLLHYLLKRRVVFNRINTFWQTNFHWIFYGIVLLWVIPGVSTMADSLTSWQLLVLPVFLLSGLLRGFYFGYIRMKYGFWYAVAVHTLLLLVSLLPEALDLL